MYYSKNCGHGFDLFARIKRIDAETVEVKTNNGRALYGISMEAKECFVDYQPAYCPICGKKVEVR